MDFRIIILLLCFFGTAVLTAPTQEDENAPNSFVKESSTQLAELWQKFSENMFYDKAEPEAEKKTEKDKSSSSSSSSEEDNIYEDYDDDESRMSDFEILIKSGVLQNSIKDMKTLSEESMSKFGPIQSFEDETLKIALNNIKFSPWLFTLGDEYFDWWKNDFDDMTQNENICHHKNDNCDLTYSKTRNILKNTKDPKKMLHYWLEWRDKNKEEALNKLNIITGLHNKAARLYNVTSKFMWFVNYKDENFLDEMEKVITEMEPLYKELYAYVRHELVKKYGENLVSPTDMIPHHLFEQELSQAWNPKSVASTYFKDIKMPVQVELSKKFTGQNQLNIADDFMTSLGLEQLESEFWDNRTKVDSGDNCELNLFFFCPKPLLSYCEKTNIKKFLQLHGDFAKIHYVNQKTVMFALFESYNFEHPVGEAIILSAASPSYLHSVGIKKEDSLSEEEDMNRLFRMGVHTIFNIPIYYVHSKVISDLLEGSVPVDQINNHYWSLMQKYVGVKPPIERDDDSIDFPEKFYDGFDENHQADKFVSEIIGYQFYKSLCKKSGQYIEDDETHQLHHCNFFQNKEAGKILKEMMNLGGSQPWKKIMSHITGDENGMKADGLLEYYEHLHKWLKQKNTENGVTSKW